MSTEQNMEIRIQADAKEALVELRNVTKSLKGLETETKKMSKDSAAMKKSIDSVSKSTRSFSRALKGLVGAYVSLQGTKEFVGLLGRMEKGFVGVAKTTGLAGKELDELKDGIIDLSTELSGVETAELQGIAEAAGQLGISGKNDILSFTETIAKMAVATDLSADEAATAFAKLGNVLGEPVSQYERMGSVVNELSNTTNALASEVVDVSNRFAGMAKTVGMSSEDIFGLAAALKDLGLSNEIAGSSMTRLLGAMLSETEKFAKISGVSIKKWSQMMETDPVEALNKFLAALGKMSAQDQVKALKELKLTSVQTSSAVLKLAKNTGTLSKDLKTAREEWQKNTSLQKEYETAARALDAQFIRTKNMLVALALRVGDSLLPVIKEANDDFKEWVDGLDKQKLAEFGDTIAQVAKALAEAAGVVGKFVAALGSIVGEHPRLSGAVLGMVGVLKLLNMTVGKVTWSMAASGSGTASLVSASGAVKQSLGGIAAVIRTTAGAFGPLGLAIAGAIAGVSALANAYENSRARIADANMASAKAMEQHTTSIEKIGAAYKRADEEAQKHGAVTAQTAQQIRQALEEEIAAIEKQLSAWEQQSDTTDQQNKNALQLAGTLGQLKAKLDTLEADYNIELGADTSEADQDIQQVTDKASTAKADIKVDANTAAAQSAIDKLKKPTSSTHTVYVRTVQTKALGGMVQKLAGGGVFTGAGRVPGYDPTDSDRVNARLTGGEFVIPRRAVRHYGSGLFEQFRRMIIPRDLFPRQVKLPKIPAPTVAAFASGGQVPSSLPAARPINLTIEGQKFSMMSDDETAERLVRYLGLRGGL